MKKQISQIDTLMMLLYSGEAVTPRKVFLEFGIYRLSARIHNIRDMGVNVKTELINEHPVTFAKYYL